MLTSTASEFRTLLPPSTRLLGLDVGEKTIGLALSDTARMVASPLLTIERKKFTADMEVLLRTVTEHQVGGLVIGLPMQMDGSLGPRAQSVRQFAFNVAKATEVPLLLWDERLSTAAVARTIEEADLSRNRRDAIIDKLAASYILQGFLDQKSGDGR
jgi:putative Holliday junction resolvase